MYRNLVKLCKEAFMNLAERIKNARLNKHYTQKDLAELINVKSTTVSGWELGRNEPSIDTLKKLATKLDVSFDYLAGVSSHPNASTSDADLDKLLDNAHSYNGKPMTDHDREIIKSYLKGYFQGKE